MGPLRTQLPEGASELTLRFLNGNGEWLSGTLVTTGSLEVVLLCHGYMANQSMCRFPALASELAAAGLSSFRFDHPCAWQGASERNGPFLMGNHAAEVADIKCAAQFLRSKGRTVSVLLGHSKGGANVVMYAALHADIPKVVNLAGRYRVREGTLQRFGADILERLDAAPDGIPRKEADGFEWVMTKEDVANRINLPMAEYAAKIKQEGKVRLLCLHGRQDRTIPWEESEECAAAAGGELALVDGDHNFNKPEDAAQMIAKVVEFAKSR